MAVNNTNSIRMAGLVSGLDTETLVKQMSALTKSKINTQQQKLDLLQWQQSAYRSVISKVNTFKSTYFNSLNPAKNLTSNSLFGARVATSTNTSLKVSASSNATEATYNITNVIAKAKAATITSTNSAAGGIKVDLSGVEAGKEYTLNVAVNGQSKDIKFTYDSASSLSVEEQFEQTLDTAFSSSKVKFTVADGRINISDTSAVGNIAHKLNINRTTTSTAQTLSAFGISEDGATSQLSSSSKLQDIAFNTELVGNSFSFSINNVDFKFDKSETLLTVMDTINKSTAGVKLSLDNLSGKFLLTSSEQGAEKSISIKQTSGGLLSSMFDGAIAPSTTLSSESLISTGISSDTVKGAFDFTEYANTKIEVTVNGVTKQISLWSYDSSGVKNDFKKPNMVTDQLNAELKREFGINAPTISFKNESTDKSVVNGKFTLVGANRGDVVSIGAVDEVSTKSADFVAAMGFNESNSTNFIDSTASIFAGLDMSGVGDSEVLGVLSFDEAGTTFEVTKNTTYKDIEDASNGAFRFENGRIILTQVNTDATDQKGKAFLEGLFGDAYNFPGVPATPLKPITELFAEGENAIIEVNGTTIANSSNSITINGTTIDISSLAVGQTDISITTSKDTTKAVDAIKSFVEDYNKLISELYSTVRETKDSDYSPLTDEQREEMSETEIQKWEEKAKLGILYQDTNINKLLTELRSKVNGVNSSGTGLFSMGITVSSNYLEFGKLEINETKLTQAIEANPDQVQRFFTNEVDGLAVKVSSTIDKYTNTSSANRGLLVQIAGVENTASAANNRISKQLDAYKKLIDSLQTRYENEQQRYWKQFTSLETLMSNYSAQSSWLSEQFGGSNS